MSVARNVWRPADSAHIVPSTSPNEEIAELLVKACPAGLFTRTAEGELRVDYRGCLECGTCRLLCDEATLKEWRYPESGFGITFRFG
ncbi:ferredoxin family protein [Klebsiella sp. 10982]|uniref:Ferredoxin-like protein n=1 Tax=Klebsiella quasivariicola TaxID=2026240 RepID=A0A223U701_9ENTR|nr:MULTISPECIES: ferredoxin [Klebsiella]MEA1150168.1 ferredoxin family protein [Klebsiella pneumoniae]QBL48055.1 ferredoxin family protein [Klebsiella sp. PO552]ASV18794.1 ferredoxin family protein [Klebsiella quasivariicola]MBF7818678.1 ferredoxin family protein [Klebsiella quasivariicola]MBK2373114.1 ferredoxin family protein [Klebsiella quasivariicola]